jgi:hypothetical protein
VVPFLLEDELKAKGGIYSKGDDWAPYVVRRPADHGAEPASSGPAAGVPEAACRGCEVINAYEALDGAACRSPNRHTGRADENNEQANIKWLSGGWR